MILTYVDYLEVEEEPYFYFLPLEKNITAAASSSSTTTRGWFQFI